MVLLGSLSWYPSPPVISHHPRPVPGIARRRPLNLPTTPAQSEAQVAALTPGPSPNSGRGAGGEGCNHPYNGTRCLVRARAVILSHGILTPELSVPYNVPIM
jgi:hypothetical protein